MHPSKLKIHFPLALLLNIPSAIRLKIPLAFRFMVPLAVWQSFKHFGYSSVSKQASKRASAFQLKAKGPPNEMPNAHRSPLNIPYALLAVANDNAPDQLPVRGLHLINFGLILLRIAEMFFVPLDQLMARYGTVQILYYPPAPPPGASRL